MRDVLSKLYMKGFGIEIGAGYAPWVNHNQAHISYLEKDSKFNPDFQDTTQVTSDNFDFLCSSHVLEHVEDVIGELQEWLRVLKSKGYILMCVPDKGYTFDNPRELTTYDHILMDHYQDGYKEKQRRNHIIDFVLNTKPRQREDLQKVLDNPDLGIHYHTWDRVTLVDHLKQLSSVLKFKCISFNQYDMEMFAVLQKE